MRIINIATTQLLWGPVQGGGPNTERQLVGKGGRGPATEGPVSLPLLHTGKVVARGRSMAVLQQLTSGLSEK